MSRPPSVTRRKTTARASAPARALFELRGQVAIITGGAGLLGLQHAAAIAGAGGHPVIADVAEGAATASAAELTTRYGVDALGVGVDITRPPAVERMVRTVLDRFGRIDILINNAALTVKGGSARAAAYFAPFEEYPLDLWEEALRVNLTGLFLCCQAVGKVMVAQGSGVILNIASDVGTISPDHRIYEGVKNPYADGPLNTPIAYATTKAAVINFTRYLATYWADKGIRVNCLSPGGVYAGHDAQFVKNLTARIPLGRMAEADEYRGAVLFLVSKASSYMTGANLIVDGGRTAW
jgi:NAD(P)-dependent dehydrogenase (short-subunit alcohol dehydrogenase family)